MMRLSLSIIVQVLILMVLGAISAQLSSAAQACLMPLMGLAVNAIFKEWSDRCTQESAG